MSTTRRFPLLIFGCALATAADAQFGTGQPIFSNANNAEVRAADIDQDGTLDLVGVFGGHLKWFANTDGQGTFTPPQILMDLDEGCALLQVADVDNDGAPDILLVSDSDDDLVLLRNLGNGTFAPEEEFELDTRPEALAVADINGDGYKDLLLTLEFVEGPGVGIFFGSDLGFAALVPYTGLHNGAASRMLEVGDVDLSGGQDLILNMANDSLVVARNVAGDASTWQTEPLNIPDGPLGYVYRSPKLIDVDGDGLLDLAEARGSSVHWLRNLSDEGGVLAFEEHVVANWTTSGDGAFGRTSCSTGASLFFVPNNPALAPRWNTYVPLLEDLAYSQELPSMPRGRRPLLADFNADGNDDLVMEVNGQLTWFANTLVDTLVELQLPTMDTLCLSGAPVALPAATPGGGQWYGTQIANGLLFRNNLSGTMDLPVVHAVYPEGGCPVAAATAIRVIERPSITTTVPGVICSADAPIVLHATPTDVAWYGMDGSNVIDPATWGGGYVVCEYTDATGQQCSQVQGPVLRWNTLPAQLAEVDTLCSTDALVPIPVVAAPALGVSWEGPVLNASATGALFDPSIGPGTYTVILNAEAYAPNQCRNSDTIQVVVAPTPTIAFEPMAVYCAQNGAFDLVGAEPTGGVWSGSGVSNGQLDPAIVGEGIHLVSYFVASEVGCQAQASTTVAVAAQAAVNALATDLLLCDGDAPIQFDAYPAGGTWSAPLDTNGLFGVDGLDHGEYPVVYTYVDPRGCILAHDPVMVHYGAPAVVNIEPVGRLCLNSPPFELMGSAEGTWSGALTGEGASLPVDPAVLGVGVWPVTLTVTPDEGCPGEDTIDLIVDVCAGIDAAQTPVVSIAPMPFRTYTTVRFGGFEAQWLEVRDATGKQVRTMHFGHARPEVVELDLGGLADGVYLLHIAGPTGTARHRLVKAH